MTFQEVLVQTAIEVCSGGIELVILIVFLYLAHDWIHHQENKDDSRTGR